MSYQRPGELERSRHAQRGDIAGILASDGEAGDGHILNLDGGELTEGSPMLFGHDDYSGERNLGVWNRFERFPYKGGAAIRAHGQIKLGGEGAKKEWRNDMAYMIGEKAVGGLSIRWDPIDEPIRRTSLPADHKAYVDHRKAKGPGRNGLFFPRWSMLEGSVVTLGADTEAMIGRMAESEGDLRQFWRDTINSAVTETAGASDTVAVSLPDGSFAYCERAVYDAMLELANERYALALDLYERLSVGIDPPEEVKPDLPEPQERSDNDSSAQDADLQKEQDRQAATLPAVTTRMLFGVLQERLATSSSEAKAAKSAAWKRAGGKV